MDEDIPETVVASGGIYVWNDGRENPDTFSAVATYKKGFAHVFQAQFGNSFGSHSAIFGKSGTLWADGGEGSEAWTLTPRGGGRGKPAFAEQKLAIPGIPATSSPSDDSKPHFDDWVKAMRSRNPAPNGDITTGFKHSVAVIMAERALREGKKMYWDAKREEILDRPPPV
jgi:hypothetical protein